MKIKVCGMRDPGNIRLLSGLSPDYMGFIFYPPSRRFTADIDHEILDFLPISIKKTGVFVNEDIDMVMQKIRLNHLDAVQLHGHESDEYCRSLSLLLKEDENFHRVEIIKAFGIDAGMDFGILEHYLQEVDFFLFDTKTAEHGGSGYTFDWKILDGYPYDKPYFFSGGLILENLDAIKTISDSRLYAVDLNSRFETEPGLKDIHKLKLAFNKLKIPSGNDCYEL